MGGWMDGWLDGLLIKHWLGDYVYRRLKVKGDNIVKNTNDSVEELHLPLYPPPQLDSVSLPRLMRPVTA